jgi:hypothetical protein
MAIGSAIAAISLSLAPAREPSVLNPTLTIGNA